MATVGFDSIEFGILDENEVVTKRHIVNASAGGAISAGITGLGTNMTTTYASNVPFYVSAQGTGEPKLELEIGDIPADVLADLTGLNVDATTGIGTIGANNKPPYVAVILKSKDKEGKAIYISLLKGKFTYDGDNLKTGDANGAELQTDKISGTFIARALDSNVYAKGREAVTGFTYTAFEDLVFQTA